ncbi:ATP-binding protein [Streptomyces cinereoruber]
MAHAEADTDVPVPGVGRKPRGRSVRPSGFDVSFLPEPVRVRQMRRITRAHLIRWDLDELIDNALLVVSELVTNAIDHGEGSPVRLTVTCSNTELRVEVTDGSPKPARRREPEQSEESGRGLLIVEQCSREWGVSENGSLTWCCLAFPDEEGRWAS